MTKNASAVKEVFSCGKAYFTWQKS